LLINTNIPHLSTFARYTDIPLLLATTVHF